MNVFEWLDRLIAFDTTSRNSNLELIHDVQTFLESQGIHSSLIHDSKQPKANLFASLPAFDGRIEGGIVLSGHTDVVPVDGQQWETDPFKATKIAGKIYGRGACDMKGFIAVVMAMIPQFKEMKLAHPVHFAFSYDEEVGCLGAPFMIEHIKRQGINPAACIVGEPTSMRPVIAHKGKESFRCSVHGVAAHSSLTHQGCNAIEYAADLICYIRGMADRFKQSGIQDKHYDMPCTTLTTNLISGGNSYNTIPALCEFIFEFRNLPEDSATEIRSEIKDYINTRLLPKMKLEHSAANIILDNIAATAGLNTPVDAEINQWARMVTGEQEKLKVAYATEAGLFQKASIPTIVCGPGSIEQAHRANEYVDILQLQECSKFLNQMVQMKFSQGV
ncbi:acetylornithine deacetylase [Legionella quinlivanii]|uniref:Acetylornithine deacetylase n=1 Tax=Legionella quinlivanii TaxID=45073 RepID=A0A0W0Y4G7_9GAMM|nr:acetylornithine deacetylase [Legionella quinlivanii]KTD51558.1 acetylornithine deacetylase [Legionella quinlivanii]SEF58966.1 acetylornithine deacetylase [Legionella quinlivanii DSM 21216]STY10915.1 acetylornithine deacetylase [Legionella quinlivanii]